MAVEIDDLESRSALFFQETERGIGNRIEVVAPCQPISRFLRFLRWMPIHGTSNTSKCSKHSPSTWTIIDALPSLKRVTSANSLGKSHAASFLRLRSVSSEKDIRLSIESTFFLVFLWLRVSWDPVSMVSSSESMKFYKSEQGWRMSNFTEFLRKSKLFHNLASKYIKSCKCSICSESKRFKAIASRRT